MQKTIRCAKDNEMCKKTTRCAKENNKMYKKRKKNSVLGLNNSNVNKRDVQTGCSWYCTWSSNDENVMIFTVDNGSCE